MIDRLFGIDVADASLAARQSDKLYEEYLTGGQDD